MCSGEWYQTSFKYIGFASASLELSLSSSKHRQEEEKGDFSPSQVFLHMPGRRPT